MSSFLGNTSFRSDTANLFRDEESAKQHAMVVDWLNSLGTAVAEEKVELIIKLREILLGNSIEMLEESLEQILSLSLDQNMEVRKQVVIFVEAMCQKQIQHLPKVISIIGMLLRDRSSQVVKRVIQACISIYKLSLQWISGQQQLSEGIEQSWHMLSVLKAQILDLIDNENEGVRTIAIKFLESVVILQSYPDEDSQKKPNDFSLEDMPEYLKMIKRQKLEQEAHDIFDILLKLHAATHVSAANLTTCSSSLANIAKMRPAFMGAVVEAYKQLLNNNMPPTLSNSQVSNVRKHLKNDALNLLKHRGAYEFQTAIKHMLIDLGVSQYDIQRAIPKMDKQEQARRQKRILDSVNEFGSNLSNSKRMRYSSFVGGNGDSSGETPVKMVVDEVELQKQRDKSLRVNEKFLNERLRSQETVVNLLMEFLPKVTTGELQLKLLSGLQEAVNKSVSELLSTSCKLLAEQMTDQKIGPGADAFTKQSPMRPARPEDAMKLETNQSDLNEEQQRKEEATKKLRENMERMRGEQELIKHMQQRAKALKLQEITKPLSRASKEKFLLSGVQRILNGDKGFRMSAQTSNKRIKLLANIAATFPDNVRYAILDYILDNIEERFDLALCWTFAEYDLILGYTRHTYVKSENRPDHAYNELIDQLILAIRTKYINHTRSSLLEKIYLDVPIVTDTAIEKLLDICTDHTTHQTGLMIVSKLAFRRYTRRTECVNLLLTCCVHDWHELRELALVELKEFYGELKEMQQHIEQFALKWAMFLEQRNPPNTIFCKEYGRLNISLEWEPEVIKACLSTFLLLMQMKASELLPKLGSIFVAALPAVKRQILRTIDTPIRNLGADNAALLQFVSDCPKGTDALLVRIVYLLCDRKAMLNKKLVELVSDMYGKKLNDPRIIIPVLHGLKREQVLELLPSFMQLNIAFIKDVLHRLLRIGEDFCKLSSPVTPAEVLIGLNTMDGKVSDVKLVLSAINLCLAERHLYSKTVLEQVLFKLTEMQPTPKLLMRTMLQSLSIYPQLADCVIKLLQRLIAKQIWNEQDVLWKGFVKCCQHLKHKSMDVLISLPGPQLQNALKMSPDLRAPLQSYVESIKHEPTREVSSQKLDIIAGINVDVFVTDESGGYLKLDNIKKEIEDISEISTIATVPAVITTSKPTTSSFDANQPLPPGED